MLLSKIKIQLNIFLTLRLSRVDTNQGAENREMGERRKISLTATLVSGCLQKAEFVNSSGARCLVDLRLNLGDIGIPLRTGAVGDHTLGQGQRAAAVAVSRVDFVQDGLFLFLVEC